MERKHVSVNIYNFIRMSHTEPTRFIQDDFDTIRRQIITVKQYGFPGTYALKYDALMDYRYQELMKQYLDEGDELSAWWEITRELCERSGVPFRSNPREEVYDDRVNSAYSSAILLRSEKNWWTGTWRIFFVSLESILRAWALGSWIL